MTKRSPSGPEPAQEKSAAPASESLESNPAGRNDLYHALVEGSPHCIHRIDRRGRLLSMNAAGLEMVEAQDERQVVGSRYLDSISAGDQPRIAKLLEGALAGTPSRFEFESANGRYFASSFVPIPDADGVVGSLIGITHDITEHRETEKRLLASEQRLELALQGADLGLWDWDIVRGTLDFNERFLSILGHLPGELEQHVNTMRDLTHPEDAVAVRQRVADNLEGRTDRYESEHRMRAKDGSWVWLLDRGTVVERDPAGNPLRSAGTVLDVTERHREESERRELEARLQQAQKMESVGQLAGGIAHDFNNLLQVILGNVQLARATVEAGQDPGESLDDMQKATVRAADLTRRLLTLSRQQVAKRRVVDLNDLVGDLLNMISRVLPENIRLELDRCPQETRVEVDPGQVEQALINLCVNARDAMPKGGDLVLTTALTRVAGSNAPWVRLSVRDSGHGMSPTVRERAFDPFFSTKGPKGGTGLGLAMVYGIVKQNNGTISLESEPGSGTCVALEFPRTDKSIDADRGTERVPESATGETILVVEDEDMVREFVAKLLVASGYRVLTAVDGVDGVEVFRRERAEIDLVLMDAIMPRLDGHHAGEQMLQLEPSTKILFTSGYHEGDALPADFLSQHGLKILAKPYQASELLVVLREALTEVAS